MSLGWALLRPLYKYYFRVRSYGAERIPADGPVILASNHSGTLPFDASMLWADVLVQRHRVARPVADYFVPGLPFVSPLFARAGVVSGSNGNLAALLGAGELIVVFPEGIPGIAKPFSKRYQLQKWRVGHAELAIRHRVPVVPVGIVGAEEQMPQLLKLERLGQRLGWPHVPVPLVPFPLPVRYHIHYGEPLHLYEGLAPGDADVPDLVRRAANRVHDSVEALVREGLHRRRGIFQ